MEATSVNEYVWTGKSSCDNPLLHFQHFFVKPNNTSKMSATLLQPYLFHPNSCQSTFWTRKLKLIEYLWFNCFRNYFFFPQRVKNRTKHQTNKWKTVNYLYASRIQRNESLNTEFSKFVCGLPNIYHLWY